MVYMPLIPALGKAEASGSLRVQGQPGLHGKSRTAKVAERNPVLKNNNKKSQNLTLLTLEL